jgi:hypothetical protein
MVTELMQSGSEVSFIQGMDQQEKSNRTDRLANLEAFRKFGADAAAEGNVLSTEQWASMSQNILGRDSWLSSTSPSADAIGMLQQNQAKSAQQTAEVRRREQFKADDAEEKSAFEAAQAHFAGGLDDPVKVLDQLNLRYSPEVIAKLKPKLERARQLAMYSSEKEGLEYGKKFNSVAEAEEFVKANQHLSKYTAEGMVSSARANEEALVAKVTAAAATQGTTGWRGDEDDTAGMMAIIDTAMPRASAEAKYTMLKSALKTAQASHLNKVASEHESDARTIRTNNANNATASTLTVMKMESEDAAKRQADAKRYSDIALQTREGQKLVIDKLPKKLKPDHALEVSTAFATYAFKDPLAYAMAVQDGDEKTKTELLRAATPMSVLSARADAIGRLVTGNFRSAGEAAEMFQQSALGVSEASAISAGKIIQVQSDISNSGKSAEVTQTAKRTALVSRQGFITDAAADIKGFRDAVQSNTHIGAEAGDMQQHEFGIAMQRARWLSAGMRGATKQSEVELAQEIMRQAGPSSSYTRTPYPAERFQTELEHQRGVAGLDQRTGWLPGAGVPSPRAKPTGGWAPADF